MLHSKDTGWLIGLKIKILLYAAYKRFTRAKDTNRLKMRGWTHAPATAGEREEEWG